MTPAATLRAAGHPARKDAERLVSQLDEARARIREWSAANPPAHVLLPKVRAENARLAGELARHSRPVRQPDWQRIGCFPDDPRS